MIHLTLTGYYAGRRLCDKSREDGEENAHAIYAPLGLSEYRAKVCPKCLREYALSFDVDEEKPEWVVEILGKGE